MGPEGAGREEVERVGVERGRVGWVVVSVWVAIAVSVVEVWRSG